MAKLFNRTRVRVLGSPGTGTISLGGAFSNAYCTFAESGVSNSDVVAYFVEDGDNFEIGIGTYTTIGTTMSRDTVTLSKTSGVSGTTKVSLTSSAIVYLSPRAQDFFWFSGPSTPVVSISMAADYTLGTSADVASALVEAGIWSGKVYNGALVAKSFDSSNNSAGANQAPNTGMFVYTLNSGVNNDAVAILGDVVVNANGCDGFGANFIARNNSGITGSKLVGCELDVEFAAGTTAGAGTAGLYINIFNAASAGAAIQTGGHGAGTWTNGVVLDGLEASVSAGLAPNSGSSLGALINTGTATYGLDAAVFSNTHKLRFSGTGSSHGKIFMDGSDFLHIVGGASATVFRNKTDTTSLLTIADDGTITTGTGSALKVTGPVDAFAFSAIPAGGTAGSGYMLSSTANFGIFFGSGTPTLSAAKGSLYLRSDGSTINDRAYINTNGSTTWTALTTAA